MAQSPDVRPYRPGDEVGIRRLFHEVFGREMSPAEWNWKYTGRGNEKVYAVVAVTGEGEVVGHYGGTPSEMIYRGRPAKGMSLGDVMIHPRYRGLKTFRRLTHAMEEFLYQEGFLMVYGFPTEETLMLLSEKIGLYERVEDVLDFSKVGSMHNNAQRFIYKLFPLKFTDGRIDELWDAARNEMGLALVRDREYFTWRYQKNPLYSYELWGMRRRWSKKLLALFVVRRDSHDKVLVMDLLCKQKFVSAVLIKAENLSAAASGSPVIRLWLPSYMHRLAEDRGFARGSIVSTIPCTTHPGFLTSKEIKGIFFYTMGDTDFL